MPISSQATTVAEPLQWEQPAVPEPQQIEPRFTVGRDSHGGWTVTDREDHIGGTFVNESAALSFARQEANHDLSQIRRLPDGMVVEFRLH